MEELGFRDITAHFTLEMETGLTLQGFGSGYLSVSSLFPYLSLSLVPHNFQITSKGSFEGKQGVSEVPAPEVQCGIQVPTSPGSLP